MGDIVCLISASYSGIILCKSCFVCFLFCFKPMSLLYLKSYHVGMIFYKGRVIFLCFITCAIVPS